MWYIGLEVKLALVQIEESEKYRNIRKERKGT